MGGCFPLFYYQYSTSGGGVHAESLIFRRRRNNLQNEHMFVKKKYLTPFPLSCNITRVIAMEKILEQTLLYDFYGELLTEHQKRVYEDVVLNDYSLSEIADELGISRQGVHDMVKRCSRLLNGYEEKLHLVEKFVSLKEKVGEIRKIAKTRESDPDMEEIEKISARILEEL